MPRVCEVKIDDGPVRWSVGDFDTDGRLDLYVSGPKSNELWENTPGGQFRPVIRFAGSLNSRNQPAASACLATDLNHDGRPDLALFFKGGQFLYHFNRGYRCMAEEGELSLDGDPLTGEAAPGAGPVSAVAGDLDGNGSLDLAVACAAGDIRGFLNGQFEGPLETPALWVRLKQGQTGPITVSVWQGMPEAFCVGTYVVSGSAPVTYVALRDAGPCALKWSVPGGGKRTRTVQGGDKHEPVVIDLLENSGKDK